VNSEVKIEMIKNAKDGVEYGDKLMEDTNKSAARTKNMLGQAFEEAETAAQTLADQRKQFETMIETTYEVEDEMKRARKITGILLRRVMQDKVMWCFMFLIIIGVVVVIVKEVTKQPTAVASNCSAITLIGFFVISLLGW